jgi:hypothetical protein
MDSTILSAPALAPLTQPVRRLVGGTVGSVLRWPVESQLGARRNALVASTALARRRAERLEVEEFLAARGQATVHAPAGRPYLPEARHG